jgi:hypothetical protein
LELKKYCFRYSPPFKTKLDVMSFMKYSVSAVSGKDTVSAFVFLGSCCAV